MIDINNIQISKYVLVFKYIEYLFCKSYINNILVFLYNDIIFCKKYDMKIGSRTSLNNKYSYFITTNYIIMRHYNIM